MIRVRSVTGKYIDLGALQIGDIELDAVACGLSNVCRFSGQTPRFYSVAQHSVLVADLIAPDLSLDRWGVNLRLHGIFHDGHEAWMGDLHHFLKHSPALEGYRVLADYVQGVVERRFHLIPLVKPELILLKAADDLAAVYEDVTVVQGEDWEASILDRLHTTRFTDIKHLDEMEALAPRLPASWRPWDPTNASFLFAKEAQAAMRARASFGPVIQ